jgi:hypothetical protein
MTALAKAVRFASVATAEEKYFEPVQPPMDSMGWTFWHIENHESRYKAKTYIQPGSDHKLRE